MNKKWSREHIEILFRDYPTTSTKSLAEQFGRTSSQVVTKATSIGLKKTPEFISQARSAATASRRARQ